MKDQQALQLLNALWADIGTPDFLWQGAALLLCLIAAWACGRWWAGRQNFQARLHDAGIRLVFPLAALIFTALARAVLEAFVHVNLLKVAVSLLLCLVLVRSIIYVLRRAFPAKVWLTAWERIIALIVWFWLALYVTDLAPFVIDLLEGVSFSIGKQRVDLWMVLHGLVAVLLTVLLALWVGGLVDARLMRLSGVDSSLRIVLVRIAKALMTLLAIMVSFSLVGIDMTALSVFTGALGVGLGFGLQKIASNYVSGFIILLDRSIRLGNVIQVDGNTQGIVQQITTRYTVLRNLSGVEYIVPNETLVSNIVQNQSYSNQSVRVAVSLGVAYDTDLDLAMGLMTEAATGHSRVLADPAPKVSLSGFGESAIHLELGFWINDPQVGTGGIRSDISLEIWRLFKQNSVDIPFPQREIRVLSGAGNGAGGQQT